jgi:hypothetical protein
MLMSLVMLLCWHKTLQPTLVQDITLILTWDSKVRLTQICLRPFQQLHITLVRVESRKCLSLWLTKPRDNNLKKILLWCKQLDLQTLQLYQSISMLREPQISQMPTKTGWNTSNSNLPIFSLEVLQLTLDKKQKLNLNSNNITFTRPIN